MDAALRARGMLVYILLLRVVDAHERLDRFDYPLGIAYEIAIGIGWDEPYQVTDLLTGVSTSEVGADLAVDLDPAAEPFRIFSIGKLPAIA